MLKPCLYILATTCFIFIFQSAVAIDSVNYYLQHHDLQNAVRVSDKKVTQLKNDHYAWFQRGEVYIALAKDKKGIADISKENATDIACNCFIKSVQLAKKTGKVSSVYITRLERCYDELFSIGVSYYKKQDFEKSYQFFETSIQVFNALNQYHKIIAFDTIGIYFQTLTLEKTGNIEVAKKNYLKLLSMKYSKPEVYLNLAHIYSIQEQFDNAIKTLKTGLVIAPDNRLILSDLVRVSLIAEKQKELLALLKDIVKNKKANAYHYFILGSLYDDMNFTLDAESFYIKSLEKDSNFLDAAYNLGILYYNSAIEKNKLLNETERDNPSYKVLLSERNLLLKKAEPYFKKAQAIKPKESEKALKYIRIALGQS